MIDLKNISKTYKMGDTYVKALQNVSVCIKPGEFVAIMGPSGSGKSTMLHILGFLDRPDSGKYYLDGTDISSLNDDQLAILRNQVAGFVFQQFHLLPRITAANNVALPLVYAGRHNLKEIALDKIRAVGLSFRANHQPNELSGGERQRIAIARSLVNEPLIIFADEPTGNLDTKSEIEIMAILKELNDKGKTIILVTHEQEVAEHAKRIISMRDGHIVSDTLKVETKISTIDLSPIRKALSKSNPSFGRAEISDHIRQSVHAILSNRMRSLLSMLGILIGVAAVIAMLAIGQGAQASIKQKLSSLGTNRLTVRPGASKSGAVMMETGSTTRFTIEDTTAMERLTGVKYVSPIVNGRAQLVAEGKNWNSEVQGTGVDYSLMHSSVPKTGRFITSNELLMRERVAVVGMTVVRQLFSGKNPVGKSIRINKIIFEVIGVLPEKGATGFRDEDDIVIIPITTAMYRLLGKQYVDSIDVEVSNQEQMSQVQTAIKQLVIKRHHLTKDNEGSFDVRNMADLQSALTSTTKTMTLLLGAVAAISLLVGGIGIMNIMLVSVTERTREIGLRKAIGARRVDIITQFLIEAVLMTVIGGFIGIIFGIGTAALLSVFAGWATKISPISIIMATTFSISIGIVFGLKPAVQAAALNPIEALRYE
ncbi:MAG: MacB family efflux pump subunit [Omnitrophica WOR_2 bacterium GWF2_38_59]|nr:MAG: MacB family efflux pump subunit [Omnitrophica WOR_2 bacterium GWF2_38_59]